MCSDFEPQCFYSLVLQSCFLFKNKNMKRGREEKKTQHGSTRSLTIWCSILCMNNLLFKNCLEHVHHSGLFIALFDLNSQHGSTRSITIWCRILCMNNLLFKNCLKHVHHSDLFIALFDLNSLSLAWLGAALVKYCYKITYKKTWKHSKRVQISPYHVYIIDTCAAKIHPHS